MSRRSERPGALSEAKQGQSSTARRSRYRSGLRAEFFAEIMLRAQGCRIVARRFRVPVGEIDLITVRGGRIGFVEVKRRRTLPQCEAAITLQLRQRVRRASDLWFARNPDFQGLNVGYDLVFVVPWRLPVLLPDAL